MDPFDPALHYGPNDAGVSALTISLVVLALLVGSWGFGAVYALITNYFKNKNSQDD